MALDILFINPGNQKAIYQDLALEFTALDVPVWACLLAESIRRQGRSVQIHDMNIQGWDDATRDRLLAEKPRLVVVMVYGHHPSASTQTMPVVRPLLQDLKAAAPDIPVAIGGTHPSALPEQTLAEEAADFLIEGEGLYTLLGLLDHLDGKTPLDTIPGLWRRTPEGAVRSAPPRPIEDLDTELPGYAWDLLPPLDNYRAHNWQCFQYFEQSRDPAFLDVRRPYVSLYTSLNCPHNCDYCCIHTIFGKPGIKNWSMDTVIGWIDDLVNKHGVRNFRFADELFMLNRARVTRFCELLEERGYDLNIWVYARIDTIFDDLLPRLKKVGVNWICPGIESGNAEVRADVNKNIRRDVVSTIRAIQDAGIHIIGNYMFGLPHDTLETMQQTLDLALELNCEFANFYTVMAYPGSDLYRRAKAAGLVPDRWEAFSQHSYWTQPLPTDHLSPAQVQAFRDNAFQTYFNHPAYRERVRTLFGPKTCDHLDKMVSIPLKRRLTETGSP